MWNPDGDARPRARSTVDARSILGVSALRPAFLDDISAAQSREAESRRPGFVTFRDVLLKYSAGLTSGYELPRLTPISGSAMGRKTRPGSGFDLVGVRSRAPITG